MYKYFLLLFFSISAFAGNGSGNVSQVVQVGVPSQSTTGGGGAVLQTGDVSAGTYYQINAFALSSVSSVFYPFYKNGVVFSVASGHVARCVAGTAGASKASEPYQLFNATATITPGTGTPTGGVYQCGSAGNNCVVTSSTAGASAAVPGPYTFDGTSSTVYPGVNSTSGDSASVWVSLTCITI